MVVRYDARLLSRMAELQARGLSIVEMAKRVRRDRRTVSRYIRHLAQNPLGEDGAQDARRTPQFLPTKSPAVPSNGIPGNGVPEIALPDAAADAELGRRLLDGATVDALVREGHAPANVLRVLKTLSGLDRLEATRRSPVGDLQRRLEILEGRIAALETELAGVRWRSDGLPSRITALEKSLSDVRRAAEESAVATTVRMLAYMQGLSDGYPAPSGLPP